MNVCDPLWSNVTATKQQIEIADGGTEEFLVCEPVEHLFPYKQMFHRNGAHRGWKVTHQHFAMASARAAGLTSAGKAVGIAWTATGAMPRLIERRSKLVAVDVQEELFPVKLPRKTLTIRHPHTILSFPWVIHNPSGVSKLVAADVQEELFPVNVGRF
jgi:hypothetical protein